MANPIKRFLPLALLVVFVSLFSLPAALAQNAELTGEQKAVPVTGELVATETIRFQAPPPLLVASGMKCDLNGNIYLVYSSAPQAVLSNPDGAFLLPVQKLSVESKTVVPYSIPSISDYQLLRRIDFDVDGRGRVYALLDGSIRREGEKPRDDFLIVKFKDDGTMDSFVKIRGFPGGERFFPAQLSAFADGNFLISGTRSDPRGLGIFTAVFSRSGAFVTELKVPHDPEPVRNEPTRRPPAGAVERETASPNAAGDPPDSGENSKPPERPKPSANPGPVLSGGFAVSAPDGNVYVLRATDPLRLYVISPAGMIEREFEIPSAAPGFESVHMATAGLGNIFIRFVEMAKRGQSNSDAPKYISLYDLNTGRPTAVYRVGAAEGESSLAACAASPYDFLFVGTSESNQLQVVRYTPRDY